MAARPVHPPIWCRFQIARHADQTRPCRWRGARPDHDRRTGPTGRSARSGTIRSVAPSGRTLPPAGLAPVSSRQCGCQPTPPLPRQILRQPPREATPPMPPAMREVLQARDILIQQAIAASLDHALRPQLIDVLPRASDVKRQLVAGDENRSMRHAVAALRLRSIIRRHRHVGHRSIPRRRLVRRIRRSHPEHCKTGIREPEDQPGTARSRGTLADGSTLSGGPCRPSCGGTPSFDGPRPVMRAPAPPPARAAIT